MKLIEISDVKHTSLKLPYKTHNIDRIRQVFGNQGKLLGSGRFATAHSIQKDIRSVVKIAAVYPDLEDDGYYGYLKEIIKMQDNPYVPQILEIVEVTSKDQNVNPYLIVNLEQLHDFDSCSKNNIEFILTKMLGYVPTETNKQINSYKNRIIDIIDNYCETGKDKNFKIIDEQLLEVLNAIYDIHSYYSVDIHSGNIMVRKTSYGPQLVITDPLIESDR
jgi:hypothetical protein